MERWSDNVAWPSRYSGPMLSLASSLITIVVNVAYMVDVLRTSLGGTALILALPYLLSNVAPVIMLAASVFSRPIKSDERWGMFFVAFIACNMFALLQFAGITLVSPSRIIWLSAAGILITWAIIPFYVWAVFKLGRQLTVMPEARRLITVGPYRVSRHPLYVTYILWFLLQIAIAQSLVILALATLMTVLLIVRARGEEEIMAAAFPVEYAAYRQRVGWVGRWSPWFASRRDGRAES